MPNAKFTAEEILKLATIGQISIAPDGSYVVFELKENDLEKDEVKTDLWWVETSGTSEAKRLTSSGKESAPSWDSHSQRIAFISGRSGKPQVHVLGRNGGEAVLYPSDCRPAGVLLWSRNNRYIAFG